MLNNFFEIKRHLPHLNFFKENLLRGGRDGIRTHDNIAAIHAFQACRFNRSRTLPIIYILSSRDLYLIKDIIQS